jgi:hypothetical protein
MNFVCSAAPYFTAMHPAALDVPHLITALDSELLGQIAHLTKSALGVWPVPALFDEGDVMDRARESAPFSAWALLANQAELLAFGPVAREIFFGTRVIVLNALFDEPTLARLMPTTGERLETGAYVTHSFEDSPTLAELLEECGWALIPIGAGRSKAIFLVSPRHALLVTELQNWCERHGRNVGTLKRGEAGLIIEDAPAPEKHRGRVIAQHIDIFLGQLETYFGPVEESLGTLVEQRIRTQRQLRERIEHSKQGDASVAD